MEPETFEPFDPFLEFDRNGLASKGGGTSGASERLGDPERVAPVRRGLPKPMAHVTAMTRSSVRRCIPAGSLRVSTPY